MSELVRVRSILKMAMLQKRGLGPTYQTEGLPFITISRQTGAGGHSLARALLREMALYPDEPAFQDWYVFDSILLNQVLEDFKLNIPLSALKKEEYHSTLEELGYQLLLHRPSQSDVIRKLSWILRSLAVHGNVIVVGRGAVGSTGDLPGGLHLRLCAPVSIRLERIKDLLKVDERGSRRFLMERDTSRARLFKDYFRRDIDDPTLYHLVCNTHFATIGECASLVVQMLRSRILRGGFQNKRGQVFPLYEKT